MTPSVEIHLINLDRRPDRREQVESQLRRLGLPFTRFSAIDGKLPGAPIADVQVTRFIVNQKKSPVTGELACAASHMEVWKNFLDGNAEYALVLEDDINISDALKPLLAGYPHALTLDFLNLSSNVPYRVADSALQAAAPGQTTARPAFFEVARRKLWKELEWRRKWRIFRIHRVAADMAICECDPAPALGSGYIISRKAAQHFLRTGKDLFFPIDLVWRFSPGMLRQGFLATPIVTQTDADTDIPGRFDQSRIPLKYRILRPFLKNRRWKRRLDVVRLYGLMRH